MVRIPNLYRFAKLQKHTNEYNNICIISHFRKLATISYLYLWLKLKQKKKYLKKFFFAHLN